MSDAKTGPTGQSAGDFLGSVEPAAKREDAHVLDAMFREITGEEPRLWGPSIIGYGEYRTTYDSGRDVHWMRTGFSPRKARHSLYLMGGYCDASIRAQREALLEKLGKYSRGKSCLYVNKLADVDRDVLRTLIEHDWSAMNRLYPAD